MKDAEKSKEHIIEVTTALIEECGGETERITSRMIAQKQKLDWDLLIIILEVRKI